MRKSEFTPVVKILSIIQILRPGKPPKNSENIKTMQKHSKKSKQIQRNSKKNFKKTKISKELKKYVNKQVGETQPTEIQHKSRERNREIRVFSKNSKKHEQTAHKREA